MAERSIDFYASREEWHDEIMAFCVAIRPHRFWRVGDVFVASSLTGAGRWAITGISSKGRRLVNFWVSIDGEGQPQYFRAVAIPREMANRSPTDAGLRRFAVGLAGEIGAPLQ